MISKIYKGFALLVLSAAVLCGCGGKHDDSVKNGENTAASAEDIASDGESGTNPTESEADPSGTGTNPEENQTTDPAATETDPATSSDEYDSYYEELMQSSLYWKETATTDGRLVIPELPMPDFTLVNEQYEAEKNEIKEAEEGLASFLNQTQPCIHITTESKTEVLSKDEYVASVIDVYNCDEDYELSANAGVKVRGNSSAILDGELPYRIKFEHKQGMLGLHDGRAYKSWVLLKTYWHLAPEYTAFSLAKTIFEGKYYSTDFCFVHLYINDEYMGMYLLCEQNQAAKGRVEVAQAKEDDLQTNIGYFLEMDNRPDEEHPFFVFDYLDTEITDIKGVSSKTWMNSYSVKSDINTVEQLDYIEKYLEGCFKILYEAVENNAPMMFDEELNVVPADGTYKSAEEAVRAVIDVESMANMVILEELVHDLDVGNGSFFLAVDFSENSLYEKLTFTAPWDFNWTYIGDPDVEYEAVTYQLIRGDLRRSNLWYIVAFKADWFKEIVKEKWRHLKPDIENTITRVEKECEALRGDLGGFTSKLDEAKDIFEFVKGRIKWLDGQWGE